MEKIYKIALWFLLPIIDFVTIIFSGMLSYGVYRILEIGQKAVYPLSDVFRVCFFVGIGSVFIMILVGGYQKESGLLNVEEVKSTVKGMSISFLCFSMVMVLMRYNMPRYVLVFSYPLSIILLVIEKNLCHRLLSMSRAVPGMTRRILIYGAGELGQELFRAIANSPKRGIHPVGFVDDAAELKGTSYRSSSFHNSSMTISVLGTGRDLPTLVKTHKIDEAWVAISNARNDTLIRILKRLRAKKISAAFIPNLYKVFHHDMKIDKVGPLPIVREVKPHRSHPYLMVKKTGDIIGAGLLIIVLLPVILWIAVAIKRDTAGPVFFCHKRIGLKGVSFNMVKFRTMTTDTDPYAVNPLNTDDGRITRVGRFLRKTSLDELPQLLNVLRGDMSLVGPRPEMPFIVDTYTDLHRQRLEVKPGITGLWQLSGDRANPIHHNMDYDLYYIKHQSFFLDIAILIETVFFAFSGI